MPRGKWFRRRFVESDVASIGAVTSKSGDQLSPRTYFGHDLTDFGHGQVMAFPKQKRGRGRRVGGPNPGNKAGARRVGSPKLRVCFPSPILCIFSLSGGLLVEFWVFSIISVSLKNMLTLTLPPASRQMLSTAKLLLRTSCTVVATGIKWTATPAAALCKGRNWRILRCETCGTGAVATFSNATLVMWRKRPAKSVSHTAGSLVLPSSLLASWLEFQNIPQGWSCPHGQSIPRRRRETSCP